MVNKIFILVTVSLLFAASSPGQAANRDTLWEKLVLISDSLRSSPAEELNLLLKVESQLNKKAYRPDSAYAFLLKNIGTLYSKEGDYLKAVQYYRHSIEMINANMNEPFVNPDYLIECYYRLNDCYDSLERIPEGMKAIDTCISIARMRKTINLFCLAAIYTKIEYLFDVGDYNNCIDYATLCELLAKQYSQSNDRQKQNDGRIYASSSLLWNVNSQLEIKNYDEAENLLNRRLRESRMTGFTLDLGTIYEQLAVVQVARGNFKKALNYFNEALAFEHESGHDISCKGILNNIGEIIYLKHNNDADRALFYFRKALAVVNHDKNQTELNSVETMNILAGIGNIYVQKCLYDSAFDYFRLALDKIKPGISEAELLNNQFDVFERQKKIGYLTSLLLDKGDAYLKLYRESGLLNAVKEAVRIYRVTDQVLDRIRNEQSDVQSKIFWRTDSRRLYEHAIEACYMYNNSVDAFYFFEKSRAILLNDQLNEQRWSGEEDIRNQTQIKKKILQLIKASENLDRDSGRYSELQSELFSNRQELNRLVQVIKERDPLYYQSFIDREVISVQDVQKFILRDHKALVEIFSGDSAVYIYTITAGQPYFVRVSKRAFDSLSNVYMSLISKASLLNGSFPEFITVSRQLYKIIFGSVQLPKGRIIISPDGQYFPFEALVTSDTGQPLNYFLYDYAVSYTYSAKYLMNKFVSITDSSSHIFLGVAPVRYPENMHLSALKESDLSLMQVQSHFNESGNLVYEKATKAGFIDRFSKYRIIQLYTHAADYSKTGEPVIYFADSALYLSDLMGEDKPVTRLIVLSACETGTGKFYKGEGIFSFNRGFAALGIPSSITNLWSVDDRSTYRLTELFYLYLAREMPIDMALQNAKIAFIKTASKKNQLPYFWAASVLVGKSDVVDLGKGRSWRTKSIVFGVLGFIIFLTLLVFLSSERKKIKQEPRI